MARHLLLYCQMQVALPEPESELQQAAEAPETVKEARVPFLERRGTRIAAAVILGIVSIGICMVLFFYIKVAHFVDRRLAAGPFADTVDIYSSPCSVAAGDALTVDEVVARLRRSGYTTVKNNPVGWFTVRSNTVEIIPGSGSHTANPPALLEFSRGKLSRIVSAANHTEIRQFELEPQLIANLSGNRERRRLIRFADIPPSLVHAVISVEDKHFFRHSGFDTLRILKAAYVDLKNGRKDQGASTLSMQLARGFWLEPGKHWKRKLEELIITMHMENKLTKQQIFEYYANQVYLGRRATFSVSGFAAGAQAYFGKDVSQLSNAESALMAGLVQRPSYYNPCRYPDRARERRDRVLSLMHHNGYLGDADYRAAIGSPINSCPGGSEGRESQYFVDLVQDEIHAKLNDTEKEGRQIYTTLDPDLQEAAEVAVRVGMEKVDRLLRARKHPALDGQPQVALIALDPRTGEVKALVGGRDYGKSQLDHVLAMRQPGSVFKPFVYAAALNTAIEGGPDVFTTASILNDSASTFYSGGKTYQPGNFHHEFMGNVTMRDALAQSLNVPTVNLASEVGFNKVVQTARRLGLNDAIKPTPAVALGAYEATPLEIAGAYTAFANQGLHVNPAMVSQVRSADGRVLYQHVPETRAALDPRVTFLMVSMLQDVLRRGTGAGVRSLGFTLPAAGKTGTSRDGWFAGFTSELLCIVWVGFDDNHDLNLEGAHSALPIWAEFMNRAAKFRPYRDAKAFRAPTGIQSAQVCAESGELAGPFCTNVRADVFINGTAPAVQCGMHDPHTPTDMAQPIGLTDVAAPRPALIERQD
jgi:penicillin-binding protein 1B